MLIKPILRGTWVSWSAVLWSAVAAGVTVGAEYKIDPVHTSVVFKVGHLQFSEMYGRFNEVQGHFAVDEVTFEGVDFALTLAADSIDTNSKKRDEHLRGPDFFNVRQFPTIGFQSTQVQAQGEDLLLTGELSMHGVTRLISLVLHKVGQGKDPWGNERIGYTTALTLQRSDYGMKNMLEMVGDEVTVMISFEGVLQP